MKDFIEFDTLDKDIQEFIRDSGEYKWVVSNKIYIRASELKKAREDKEKTSMVRPPKGGNIEFTYRVKKIANYFNQEIQDEITHAIQSPEIDPDKVPSRIWDDLCTLQYALDEFLISVEEINGRPLKGGK